MSGRQQHIKKLNREFRFVFDIDNKFCIFKFVLI